MRTKQKCPPWRKNVSQTKQELTALRRCQTINAIERKEGKIKFAGSQKVDFTNIDNPKRGFWVFLEARLDQQL